MRTRIAIKGWLLLLALACAPLASAHEDLAQLDLAAYRGKVVYLDFWASWCGPCRRSFPWMDRMQAKYAAAGLVIVAVNVDEEPKLAAQFLREVPVSLRIVYDPKGVLAAQWQPPGMPGSFLIDRSGKVRASHASFLERDTAALEKAISNMLAEPEKTTP